MFKIPTFTSNPIIYFLWNIFILIGMVLTFYMVGATLGLVITKTVFKIDLFASINDIIHNPNNNYWGVLALKINQAIVSIAIFIIPSYLFSKSINQNPLHFLQVDRKTSWFNYFFIIVLIISTIPVSSWLMEFNQNLHFPDSLKDIEKYLRGDEGLNKLEMEAFVKANSVPMLLFNILIVAILPAITEEIFFRGCIQNFVKMCFHNVHVAIIFTSIIFSAIHGDYFGFLPRFLFGLVLGYAFAYSGSIWVSILGHFLNNTITIIAYYLLSINPEIKFLKDDYSFPIYVTLIAAFGVITIIFAMSKLRFNQIFKK
jgi:uncharacterized protein